MKSTDEEGDLRHRSPADRAIFWSEWACHVCHDFSQYAFLLDYVPYSQLFRSVIIHEDAGWLEVLSPLATGSHEGIQDVLDAVCIG